MPASSEVDGDFGVGAARDGGDDGADAEGVVADAFALAELDLDDGAVVETVGAGAVVEFVPGDPAVAGGAQVFAFGAEVAAAEVDVLFGDVVDEAGAGVVAGGAGEAASEGMDEVEGLFGAGAADVAEASFFFHGGGGRRRSAGGGGCRLRRR